MPTYMVVALDIRDCDAFKAYQKAAIPLRTDSAPGANLIFVEGL